MTFNPSNDGLFVMASRFTSRAVVVYTTIFFLAMAFSAPTLAQICQSGTGIITLNSQQQVDNFQLNYGPCDQAETLAIEGSDITNLDGLSALTSVVNIFSILYNGALTNMDGLSALTSAGTLNISNNAALTHVDGLSAITTAGGIIFSNNAALANVNGLSSLSSVGGLSIGGHAALTNVDGLSSVTSVESLGIGNNDALTNLDGLSSVTSFGGGRLRVQNNAALTNLDGLSSVKGFVNLLVIDENAVLTSIDGLSGVTSAGELSISSNTALTNVNGLSNISSVRRGLYINENAALTSVDGLSALTSVGGSDMTIWGNTALTNVDGLSALTSVGGNLWIQGNDLLTNLDGLSALTSVVGVLTVAGNPSLADCQGLVTLVVPLDDYEPGPGPGSDGIPDVAGVVSFNRNLNGCNSVLEILAEAPLFKMNAGLNDAWFNLETNGQGFLIIVFPEIKQVFMAWFTYDTERPPEDVTAFLGEPGHRWLTAQGEYEENIAILDVYITAGGLFDSPLPEPVTEPYGEIMLEFSTCNAGTVTYDIPSVDRQGVIPIERIVLDNVPLCYLLNSEAAEEATKQ
jgi:flagellar basal body rod protein FlgG